MRKRAGPQPYVAAIEAATGKEIWRVLRPWPSQPQASYATALIYREKDHDIVAVQGWDDVRGYDLRTGRECWVYPFRHGGRHLVAGIGYAKGVIFVSGYREIRALSTQKLMAGKDPLLWRCPLRGEKCATPIYAEGLLFGVTEAGVAFCVRARTGKLLWRKRLPGRYFASPVVAGDKVYFISEKGKVTVVQKAGTFFLVSRSDLRDRVYATPAPHGEALVVRTEKAVLYFSKR